MEQNRAETENIDKIKSLLTAEIDFNKMWLFSKDSLSNFPFTKVSDKGTQLLNGWTLYNCIGKKGEELSMFVHETQTGSDGACVQNAIKRMKTLRHPDIVSYVDSCEGGKEVHIVTERVQTLEKYLREKGDSGNMTFISSWGIYELMRALVFLNETGKCRHNQVRISSIFVNKSGDWKIGALDHVCGIDDEITPGTIIQSDLYWPPQDRCYVDSYGLGCLLWEVYNRTLTSVSDLKVTGSMPAQLIKVYQRLTHTRAKARITVATALKEVTSSGGLCDNYYVQTLLFLEQIQIKDEQEKKQFMTTLSERVDSFPDEINKYKVLPHLLTCHQFGAAGIEVLVPLVKLGKLLDPAEFETKVVPCLIAMFRSSHRGTRVRLLEQLPSFIDNLPLKIVDQEIFPAILLGMTDTNPVVREATIRSVVHLAPKLAAKNLNDTLVKHIMNTQLKDEQGGIRTNATVCLAKIAQHLSLTTRQTHVLNVLLKCTRDPFTPARLSAVSALAASQHFFLVEDIATKLLPCLSFLTVDSEHEVREQTFKAIRFALTRLEEVSENPENGQLASAENKEAQNSISWTNWAVNLSSRLIKKTDEVTREKSVCTSSSSDTKREENMNEKKCPNYIQVADKRAPNSVRIIGDGTNMAEHGDDDDDDEWAPIEGTVAATVKQDKHDGWNNDDPDAFFDTLIAAECSKSSALAKKGLNLGRRKPESVVKTSGGGPRTSGGGPRTSSGGPRTSGSTMDKAQCNDTDGWANTDW